MEKKQSYTMTNPTLTPCKGIGNDIHGYAVSWGKQTGEMLYEMYKNHLNYDIDINIHQRPMQEGHFNPSMKGHFQVITSDGESDAVVIVFVFVADTVGIKFEMRWHKGE